MLGIDIKIQNIVGQSSYGIYLSLFSLVYILQIIADPGLLNYNTTYLSRKRYQLQERIGVMLGLKLTLATIFLLVVGFVALLSHYDSTTVSLLKWVSINVILLSFIMYLRSNLAAMGRYRWDSFFSILDKSILIVLCLFLLQRFQQDFQIEYLVYAQTASLSLSLICLLIVNHYKCAFIQIRFDFNYFYRILKESIPFAWLLFLMTTYTRLDAYMLERLLDDQAFEAGVYASSFRLYDAGNAFTSLFGVLLLPMFSNLIGNGTKSNIQSLLASSGGFLWFGMILISGTCIMWAEPLMQFFYPDIYIDRYPDVFRWLMFALIPLSMGYVYGALLTANRSLRLLNSVALMGVCINIILNLFLIPSLLAEGAAIATCITQSFVFIVQIYAVFHIFKLQIPILKIVRFSLYALAVIGISSLIQSLSSLQFLINFALAIIISIFAAFLLKIVPLDTLTIVRNKLSKTKTNE